MNCYGINFRMSGVGVVALAIGLIAFTNASQAQVNLSPSTRVDTDSQIVRDVPSSNDQSNWRPKAHRSAGTGRDVLHTPAQFAQLQDRAPDAVERELRTTDRMLHRIREHLGPDAPPRVRRRWQQAMRAQDGAWKHFRNNQYLLSMRRTMQIRDRIRDYVSSDRPGRNRRGGRHNREQIVREAKRLGRAIERSEGLIDTKNPRAQPEWELSRAAHVAAVHAMESGDWKLAREELRHARAALERAILSEQSHLQPDEIFALIEDARRRRDRMEKLNDGAINPQIEHRLQAATDNIDSALKNAHAGRLRRALLHTHRALNLLDEIEENLF